MGTWGEGLYDNDGALDALGDLFDELDPDGGGAHLAATVGLLLQFSPSSIEVEAEQWRDRITGSPHLGQLPQATRVTLEKIAGDPATAAKGKSRPDAHRALLGDYNDGPRYQSLFEAPGVDRVLATFAERVQARLGEELAGAADCDLYEIADAIAPMGLLLDMGTRVDQSRLANWERAFEGADEATGEEREFWDDYASRVRGVFDLLKRRAAAE